MFILLPLSDSGLPKNLREKIEIIEEIEKRAYALGMRKEDIIVDGLVATVGANRSAALETLETIRYCKENGLATVCGLSNISFGLPERSYINSAFLTMAIQAGLTMAIANPSQELLVSMAFASDLLLNKDGADIRYIELMDAVKTKREALGEPVYKTSVVPTASGRADTSAKDAVNADTQDTLPAVLSRLHSDVLMSPSTVAITTAGISLPEFSSIRSGSRYSIEAFMASALAINCGRKYFPLSKSSPTSLIAGRSASSKSLCIKHQSSLQPPAGQTHPQRMP